HFVPTRVRSRRMEPRWRRLSTGGPSEPLAIDVESAEEEPAAGLALTPSPAGERRRIVPEREAIDGDRTVPRDVVAPREVAAALADEPLVGDRLVAQHDVEVDEALAGVRRFRVVVVVRAGMVALLVLDHLDGMSGFERQAGHRRGEGR